MVSEHETEFNDEEKQNNNEINDIIEMTLLNIRMNAELRSKTFDGENIITGLLYVVATFIAGHPNEEYQVKLMKEVPEALAVAYEVCKKAGRGLSH